MEKLRNWIEEALGRRIVWSPIRVGSRSGRDVYAVNFEDGSEEDYYIDFEKNTIEEV